MKKILSVAIVIALIFSLNIVSNAKYLGDVNSDGFVNSIDALEVLLFSTEQISVIDKKAADITNDGIINSEDALEILVTSVKSDNDNPQSGYTVVEGEELVTAYKKTVIDPVIQSGEFTIKTSVVSDGKTIPTTIMVRGNDMSADISYDGIKCRLLILDKKCYMIFSDLHVYAEVENVSIPNSFAGSSTDKYVGSEYRELSGKTYICETYQAADGSVRRYYFLNGVWKASQTTVDGTTTTQGIEKFEKGVTASNFSLKGYILVSDLSKYV